MDDTIGNVEVDLTALEYDQNGVADLTLQIVNKNIIDKDCGKLKLTIRKIKPDYIILHVVLFIIVNSVFFQST